MSQEVGLKVVRTLLAGKPKQGEKGEKGGRIVGYIVEQKKTGVKKGFTVEEAAQLVHQHGAENAVADFRTVNKVNDKTGEKFKDYTLHLKAHGVKADGTRVSLRDDNFLSPLVNGEGKPHCQYSPALQAIVDKARRVGGGGKGKSKVDAEKRHAEIAAIINKKQIKASF